MLNVTVVSPPALNTIRDVGVPTEVLRVTPVVLNVIAVGVLAAAVWFVVSEKTPYGSVKK
jgi:hypothetical protein